MKQTFTTFIALLFCMVLYGQNSNNDPRPYFDKKRDLLLAQFDSKPDPDDIHAQAALGSMMLHRDLKGVKIYAVSGAIGDQKGTFIDSEELFNMVFGKRWTAANDNWEGAVEDIIDIVLPVLQKGGRVWVQEAGQSNITADWLEQIATILPASTIKERVIVVQHSNWNEKMTTAEDLTYVKEMTNYFSIDDGNSLPNDEKGDRGVYTTPAYRAKEPHWIKLAKESKNKRVGKMWQLADEIIATYYPNGVEYTWSYLSTDGVDYSDCCENWWILNIGDSADTHEKFWKRYISF